MKSAIALLLVSALVVGAPMGARAAELPSRNAKPAEANKARACTVDGQAGVLLPGSQTCVRVSGSVSAQVTAGSLSKQRANGDP
jgi:hypothetical protein